MLRQSDKLICINDTFLKTQERQLAYPDGFLVKGQIYVLSEFNLDIRPIRIRITGKRCLWTNAYGQVIDVGFCPMRFVRLSDVKGNKVLSDKVIEAISNKQ